MAEDGDTGVFADGKRQPGWETVEKVAVERAEFCYDPTTKEIFSICVGKSGGIEYKMPASVEESGKNEKKSPGGQVHALDIFTGELGFLPDYRNNMGLDVVVFDRKVLTPEKITTQFVTVPAKLVVEVDVNVELPERNSDLFQEYVVLKVRRLFAFGTEKVVWVFTKSKMVISAVPDAPWQFYDWDQDVELISDVVMNIGAYIKAEGFNPDIHVGC